MSIIFKAILAGIRRWMRSRTRKRSGSRHANQERFVLQDLIDQARAVLGREVAKLFGYTRLGVADSEIEKIRFGEPLPEDLRDGSVVHNVIVDAYAEAISPCAFTGCFQIQPADRQTGLRYR